VLRALATFTIVITAAYGAAYKASAQVYEITGGNSSLYQAGGGSLSLHAPSYNATIGAGMVGGHFNYGAKVEKAIGSNIYVAGDDEIDFLLPTDIFDASHYLFARGLGLTTKRAGLDVRAFAGTISNLYETPIFEGAGFGAGMGFLSVHKDISPKWKVYSETIVSNKTTQIASAQWEPARKFFLAMSGGVGANEPYGAVSVNLSRKWVDVLGSYISAGPNFRRVVVTSPLQAEPDKGNLLVTAKPARFLSLSGGTQSYLVPNPSAKEEESSSVRSASANLELAGALLSGTVYDSSALGERSHAAAFTARREATRWLRISSNYMVNKPKDSTATGSFFTTVSEVINQRISVNESVNTSNGRTSLLYGGSLLTNIVTISANYETFYVPVRTASPFQESLLLDVGIHLFGKANLHGSTFVGPTGHLLYTAIANGVTARDQASSAANQLHPLGNSVLRVMVVDPEQQPVEGAALMVDSRPVFTDAAGTFVLRERKPRLHTLSVLTNQFLDGGEWKVVSMPNSIRSSIKEDNSGEVVVVRRIPPSIASAAQTDAAAPAIEPK
jgi:hypothetical protein